MTTPEPRLCANLDERDSLHPGTSAMRLLTRDIIYRQTRDGRWVAEPANRIVGEYPPEVRPGRHRDLSASGHTTDDAKRADAEAKAWDELGWDTEVVPSTPETRALVRAWERQKKTEGR